MAAMQRIEREGREEPLGRGPNIVKPTGSKKAVLITGISDGGIGSALALAFDWEDCLVYGTLRDRSKAHALLGLERIKVLDLDVTDANSIAAAVEGIKNDLDGRKLDMIINNAGCGYTMPVADSSIEETKHIFDVNVFGTLAVTQAFLPMLVESKGTIVNISSVEGSIPVPYSGVYAASKAALTQLSETLRLEMEPFEVNVITAMVGAVNTNFYDNAPAFYLPPDSLYNPIREVILEVSRGNKRPVPMDADEFADSMVKELMKKNTRGKLYKGSYASFTKWIGKLMPARLTDGMFTKDHGLEELKPRKG